MPAPKARRAVRSKLLSNETALYERVCSILDAARAYAVQAVNSAQVIAYWLIGREIIEEELQGAERAGYGEEMVNRLSERLTAVYGKGFTRSNLFAMRRFYQLYPKLVDVKKVHALRGQSGRSPVSGVADLLQVSTKATGANHRPGRFSPFLSWTHYRFLCGVEKAEARSFYEIECVANRWSTRELDRQIASLLYERLALSRDKKAVKRLASKGHEVATPADAVKDPLFLEFLGLPESPSLRESDLEQAIITHLAAFLLELGKGFTFVGRQQRITLDGEHYFIDLVFYNLLLRCYVLIDLKVGRLTHQDIGQMQMYVHYYERERMNPGDNPPIGILLCSQKSEAVVRYTLPEGQKRIFASKYRLVLPSEAELAAEITRERALIEMSQRARREQRQLREGES
jgi:predicted nuclease of restriction endonuclease-like (RecB) superfamily